MCSVIQRVWPQKLCVVLIKHLAAAAKSLQLYPNLCDPIDGSPPGSSVPGILQARTLEWVAISFSNAWKWSCSVVSDSLRPNGLQPISLLHPWDFPGKSTRVGCHCLLWIPIIKSPNFQAASRLFSIFLGFLFFFLSNLWESSSDLSKWGFCFFNFWYHILIFPRALSYSVSILLVVPILFSMITYLF